MIFKFIINVIAVTSILFSFAGCRGGKRVVRAEQSGGLEVSGATLRPEFADTLRMGTVREGEKVILEFSLKNGFEEPFVVKHVVSSCGCTVFKYPYEPIMPGETAAMEVVFNSDGFLGEIIKEAKIYTSASEQPFRLLLEGRVK